MLRRFVLDGEDSDEDLIVHLRNWGPVHLRGLGGGDYRMLHNIFCANYVPPKPDNCEKVIDLGGNIGLATIYLAQRLPKMRVFIVEPFADNVRMIERNLAGLINEGRCTVEQGAMWRADEELEVLPPPIPGSFGAIRVAAASSGNSDRVAGMTMDTLIDRSGFDRVDLIKIDVEGAESGIFVNGSDWVERVRSIAIEFHGDAREVCEFDRVMKERGMATRELEEKGVYAHRPGD